MHIFSPLGKGPGRGPASSLTTPSTAKWFIALALLLGLALFPEVARAARYYIDYDAGRDANSGRSKGAAWKLAPGMKGFSGSYTHTAGDQFCFKGGVTWPSNALPLAVGYSGSSTTTMDTYGGLDRAWFAGS